ncbi:MAG: phosphate--AMP phosphotransferase [Acidobacteriota bacterium]
MLEMVNLDTEVSADVYEQIFPKLEFRLSELQREARMAGIPLIVVFEGWDAAGKGTCINRLMQPLDPRGFKVWGINAPNEEESLRPSIWRFWTKLPANGLIAIFDRSWYGRVLVERVDKLVSARVWKAAYDEILNFERQITDDGTVLVKFWLHIDKKEQKKRFKKISKDPAESWKVTEEDWRHHKQYDRYLQAVEEMLERTNTAAAPWTVIEAHDRRHARIKIFQTIIYAIEQALATRLQKNAMSAQIETVKSTLPQTSNGSVFATIDLTKKLAQENYEQELERLQDRFRDLEHQIYISRIPVVIVYEGWDAAGKGGNIKRLTQKLDPRGYEVIPVAAPTAEEKAHHYLWRFWRNVPKAGHITIFDRSWYGRVLVERVEEFCKIHEWQRAYREINEFEHSLTSFGTVLVKFWLHIDAEEQLRRFTERQQLVHKNWKITEEDWRNREKWSHYEQAIADMIQRTSTTYAPWTIVESVDKLYARIKALRTIVQAIEAALKRNGNKWPL